MKIKLNKQFIEVKICNWFEKFSGLMFQRREKAKALLFEFGKSSKLRIHSIFVFFPFLAIWLDDKNKIGGMKNVEPFTLSVSPKKHFSKLIEIPINKKYKEIIKDIISVGN